MALQRLGVSADGRFFERADGTPFFYLADTAWRLFHRLTREEADDYLRDRAAKGFTAIQAVALSEFDGLTAPNRYGDLALHDGDPTRPNERYFRQIDWVIDRAAALGLYVGLLPAWGDKVNKPGGKKPDRRIFDPASAERYGQFLGARYRDRAHLIWILGGDGRPRDAADAATWRALARGIALGVAGREDWGATLMTYHPPGGTFRPPATSSGEFFHDEPWLDFNMIQSGHRLGNRNWERIAEDWARTPIKPTLDAEPCYEDHLDRHDPAGIRFDDWHIRQRAYWAVCAGACGHTYGHDTIFRFWEPGVEGGALPRVPWREGLQHPGAGQMRHLRALFESRPIGGRIPDRGLLIEESPAAPPATDVDPALDHAEATRARDGGYALIYLSAGSPVTIDLGRLSGDTIRAHWYDPRTGAALAAGDVPAGGRHRFTPPSSGPGQDWVLALDDAARGFGTPGLVAASPSAPTA